MYGPLDILDVIQHAGALGYHGIEMAPFTLGNDMYALSSDRLKEINRCANDAGVEIIGLHWLFVKPEGLHLTSPDKRIRDKTKDFFRVLIEMNVHLGGRVLTLGSPKQRSFAPDESYNTAVKRAVEFFKDLSDDLESTGTIVGLEPLEEETTNFMTDTAATCKIVEAIGSANVGITLDTHYLRWEIAKRKMSIKDIFKLAGHHLMHLHIQDDNRKAPGIGTYDFSEFVEAVKEINWAHFVSMETSIGKTADQGRETAEKGIDFFGRVFGQ